MIRVTIEDPQTGKTVRGHWADADQWRDVADRLYRRHWGAGRVLTQQWITGSAYRVGFGRRVGRDRWIRDAEMFVTIDER